MDPRAFREEVARLLEHTAAALRAGSDRQAAVSFGTAVGYLYKAKERGERVALELLRQGVDSIGDGPTQKFTFTPGELENIGKPGHDE
jgi:hypothetical protein